MDPKFYNKSGSLTTYSFACGYVEAKGGYSLWKEHWCYHIAGKNAAGEIVHKETDSLVEARAIMRKLIREAKQ